MAEVSLATRIPARTLQRWHNEGWAPADHTRGERGILRYRRDSLPRLCAIISLREHGMRAKRAAELAEAIDRKREEVLGPSAKCVA